MRPRRPLACWLTVGLLAAGCGGTPARVPSTTVNRTPIAALPLPGPAGPQMIFETGADGTQLSTWYVELGHLPYTLAIVLAPGATIYSGTLTDADGNSDPVDNIWWDEASGLLQFRQLGDGYWQWVSGQAIEGVLVGRAYLASSSGAPPVEPNMLTEHVTGWNAQSFAGDIVPRVFDLTIGSAQARLRLDRDGAGNLLGRYKLIGTDDDPGGEAIELDAAVSQWDGRGLRFSINSDGLTRTFSGTVDGRDLNGIVAPSDGSAAMPFSGTRTEVLGFGLAARDPATRLDWQQRTRRRLAHLMMADDPAPLTLSATLSPVAHDTDADYPDDRDDDPDARPADYAVAELSLTATVATPYGGTPPTRVIHGFVTTPSTPPPANGWPLLLALNGHYGSAAATLDLGEDMYWYGDAWARRGFVVVSIDVGHRPLADRASLYDDLADGDDPLRGNGPHPAIAAAGLDSDWEEDGERAWDAMRALDYSATLPNVDMTRVVVSGLSMGGEIAAWVGALDTRVSMVVPAGFTPDLAVLPAHGNHPCWQWQHASVRDYLDVADLFALVAPRPLVVEAGAADETFTFLDPPFIDAKELTRRGRTFFADAPDHFLFYLHDDGHAYHFGDRFAGDDEDAPLGVQLPAQIAPAAPGDLDWVRDPSTVSTGRTLVDTVLGFVP
jgi:dienelactone hydrolase